MYFAYATDIGMKRSENQDRVAVERLGDNMAVAVVCDGMGGAASGGVASELAMNCFLDRVRQNFRPDMNNNSVRNMLFNAVHYANTMVFEKSREDIDKNGMGTTLVAALVRERTVFVVNVGDSRGYLMSSEGVRQITKDHTYVRMLIDKGQITEEEAQTHPMKNYIVRAVGVESDVAVDYDEIYPNGNFAVLLCSDGLSNYCSGELIYTTVFEKDLGEAVNALIAHANESGGRDNITAAVIAN